MYKVIFHLDEETKVGVVYRSIMNLIRDMDDQGDKVEIELLAISSGVKSFLKDKEENREGINNLLDKGVKIVLCNNSLRNLYLEKKDFIDGSIVVKSGVGELARKQHEGWSYIKA